MNITIQKFISELSSKSPVPGGGGASAFIGAVGVALCSMVANLTSGKKAYAEFQEDMDYVLKRTEGAANRLLTLIQKDAEVFEPLSKAYHIPMDSPEREELLEKALITACSVPLEILEEVYAVIDIIEELSIKGSKLAKSDVGVAASACRSALEGAAMNVYINTKLMKNKDHAIELNAKASTLLDEGTWRCDKVFQQIARDLRNL